MTPAERYLLLGLRIGRHVDGMVDAYFGPPELAATVEAEPSTDPRELVAAAAALLDELDDGWLRDQVAGLRTYAGVLAGEARSYPDEVEGCYGVPAEHTDESVFAAAHGRLEALLPGAGSLAERYERWRTETRVPPEQVEATVAAAIEEARRWTRELVDLPDGEGVELEVVHDEPWLAFCYYLGSLRSRIAVNLDLPISALELLHLAIHETYAGHHAERCVKEQLLVRGRDLLEETIVMVPAPQSVVSEGIAELAVKLLLEGEGGAALAAVTENAGVELDLGHALAIEEARRPLEWAHVNAALMFHEDGAAETETRAYMERWGLLTPQLSAHLLRFFKEPTSRSYVITYAAGEELCDAYVGGDPARFRRLLSEQVRVGELLAARDA
jgi:hypothetical protein